ncbi:MAG: GUN4 domain-containing protein [Pseudanabaenaceae cyanobacterium]
MVWHEGLRIYRNQNMIDLAGDNLLGRGLHRVLDDSYKLKKFLGGGAWGATWLAEYKKNGKKQLFAIKTIKDEILAQADGTEYEENLAQYLRYFNQEAAALAKCEHEHIVKIEERFQLRNENNRPCLVMEYVEGCTLWKYVERQPYKYLGQLESLKYIQQIGNALGEVHRQNLLHHDVKPHNIMIYNPKKESDDDKYMKYIECIAKLIDFGTARHFIPQLTQHYSNVLGTQGFAAPEVEKARLRQQQNRGAVSVPIKQAQSIDVYSLAATLYYMVTGAHPLDVPFSELDQVSPQVKDAILAGMQHNQSDRPATVQEWLQMLPLSRHRVFRMDNHVFEYDLERDGTWNLNQRQVTSQPHELTLKSAKNIDYRELEQLLKTKQWYEADQLTYRLMLKAAGREKECWFDLDSIKNFPCADLQTIDQLWVHYSNGLYGFSVQKQIYVECGGKLDFSAPGSETWEKFCNRTAWKSEGESVDYPDQFFNNNFMSVKGHLPWVRWEVYWIPEDNGWCATAVPDGAKFLTLLFSHQDL